MITGSDPAPQYFLFGAFRFGATRFGAHSAQTFVTIGGVDRTTQVTVSTLTITEALNEQPDTLTVETYGFTPAKGEEVLIQLGSRNNGSYEFSGRILRPEAFCFQTPAKSFLTVHAIDDTWLLKTDKIFKRYVGQSATAILIDLVAIAAPPGVSTAGVQLNLPTIAEITFTGTDLPDAIAAVMTSVGGYWYLQRWLTTKILHAFVGDEPGLTQPRALTAVHPTLTDLRQDDDLGPQFTRVLIKGQGSSVTAPVPSGASSMSVDDVSMLPASGAAIVAGQRITYTDRSSLGPAFAPSAAVALLPGRLAGTYAYCVGFLDDAGRETARGFQSGTLTVPVVSPPGGLNYQTTGSGQLFAGLYYWVITFAAGSYETAPSPPFGINLGGPNLSVWLTGFPSSLPAGCTIRLYRTQVNGSDYFLVTELAFTPASGWIDGKADSLLGAPMPVGGFIGRQVTLSNFPTSGDARVKGRRLYRTEAGGFVFKKLTDIGDAFTTTSYADNTPDAQLGAAAPEVSTFPGLVSGVVGLTTALVDGDPINFLLTVNDIAAQTARAALLGGTGIRTDYLEEDLSASEALARATAWLNIRKQSVVTLRGVVRDLQATVGRTATIPAPFGTYAAGAFRLQEVVISDFSEAGTWYPTRQFMGSSLRFSFEDLLRGIPRTK
jgi:hypothetical protein